MQWWNRFMDWASSTDGSRILSGAIIPFVAIVVAGVIAALIGRGISKRLIALQEREQKGAAVAGMISAARKAAVWSTLGTEERVFSDHLADEAGVRLRLLPTSGAVVVANWADHEIGDMKRNSATYTFQAEQSLADFRDRLIEWQNRPARAKKLFRSDLERWKFEESDADKELAAKQQAWARENDGGADRVSRSEASGSGRPVTTAPPAVVPAQAVAPVQSTAPTQAWTAAAAPSGQPVTAAPAEASPAGSPEPFVTSAGAPNSTDGDRTVDAPAEPTAPSAATSEATAEPSGAGGETAAPAPSSEAGRLEAEQLEAEPREAVTTRKPTGMVSTPVVHPPHSPESSAPASPVDASEHDEATSPYGEPVSAQVVRRRTSPESDDQ